MPLRSQDQWRYFAIHFPEMFERWVHSAAQRPFDELPKHVADDDDYRKYRANMLAKGHADWVLGTDPLAPLRPKPPEPDEGRKAYCFTCGKQITDPSDFHVVGPVPHIGYVSMCSDCMDYARRAMGQFGGAQGVLAETTREAESLDALPDVVMEMRRAHRLAAT